MIYKSALLPNVCLWFLFFSYAQPGQSELYIGTYTGIGSYGIYVAKFNPGNGKLALMDSMPATNASFLTINKSATRLYAVQENGGSDGGSVISFARETLKQKWSLLNEKPVWSGGLHPCHIALSPAETHLVVSNYSSGTLAILPLASGGKMNEPAQVIRHTGSGPNVQRQQSPHVHMAIFSGDGKSVYAADLGTDELVCYQYAGGGRAFFDTTATKRLRLQPGSGPRHIALHPKKRIGYILQELSGSITVLRLPESKLPETIQVIQADTSSAQPGSADIRLHPSAKFLYASNRADANSMAVFSVHPKTKKLSLIGEVSSEGKRPRNFCIDPSGRYMLVANQDSNNISVFSIDPNSGVPVFTGTQLSVPSPVCLVFGAHYVR